MFRVRNDLSRLSDFDDFSGVHNCNSVREPASKFQVVEWMSDKIAFMEEGKIVGFR